MSFNQKLANEKLTAVVFKSDSPKVIAEKIFNDFKANQSCTLDGWVLIRSEKRIYPRGKYIWDILMKMDKIRYWTGDGKRVRRRYINNSNTKGHVPVERKIFKYKEVQFNGEPRWTIWRIQ